MNDLEGWGANARIAAILLTLLTKGQIAKATLAERYAKNERTIERDIKTIKEIVQETLQSEVVTTSTDSGTVYTLQGGSSPFLNEQEVFILSKLLLASRSFSAGVTTELINKLLAPSKMLTSLERNSVVPRFVAQETDQYDPIAHPHQVRYIQDLVRAISQHKRIQLKYTTGAGKLLLKYEFSPTNITYYNHYWYVEGYDQAPLKPGQVRYTKSLRINRISNLTIAGDQARELTQSVPQSHRDAVGVYKGQSRGHDNVVLRAERGVAELAMDQLNATLDGFYNEQGALTPIASLTEVPQGASVQISTRLIEGAGDYIILGLDGVEVLRPESRRQRIKAALARSLARYQN